MIGVCVREEEREAATEFFELFKTPWEFYRKGENYSVLLSTDVAKPVPPAKVVILYGSGDGSFDREHHLPAGSPGKGSLLCFGDVPLPVYGKHLTFSAEKGVLLRSEATGKAAALFLETGSQVAFRVGYDLFREVRHLLTSGQPPEHAGRPTLELHIALLRSWILKAGIPVMEIPPSPAGTDFMVCLTHDVDFASIRMHSFDHTIGGFLYRALLGSIIDLFRGRSGWEKLVANWKAVLLLPAVYAGMAKDFWNQYEQYLEIESGLKSTFYLIPFKNRPGAGMNGPAPSHRACRYDISDVKTWPGRILSKGGEIGLHGLDAWSDARKGREELERIRNAVGAEEVGVRMHWLYFGAESPRRLEEAGFLYDSTWGYNDAVGFRAGTGQPFRPAGASSLMELPLVIQDTALFYKGRMGLREDEALEKCRDLIGKLREFGGVLVINWHHRSLAPERLWGNFYRKLLAEIGKERVLFVTAREAVQWFRWRRSAVFERTGLDATEVRVLQPESGTGDHARLGVRLYKPHPKDEENRVLRSERIPAADLSLEGSPSRDSVAERIWSLGA